jgi:hypothetical protein
MRFEVLVAVNIKIIVFWDMKPCHVVERKRQVPPKCWYLSAKLYSIISQSLCNVHFLVSVITIL